MKKKYLAHTFAELMISLVVVSIIAALLYPMLAKFTPNTNKPLFQAAYRTLSVIISEIVHANLNGELAHQNGNPLSVTELCQEFCARANVVAECNNNGQCSTDCNDLCTDQRINTTNGMRWHFSTNTLTADANYCVGVDVNLSNESQEIAGDTNFGITFDPNNVSTLKVQDSFRIDLDSRGKIIDMSPAGWANLEDSVDTLD